jgi:hypothetical protein
MAKENIQDIKEKVRALLMKAADAAASPAEAEGAMRAAQKLMAKYQVSEKDLGALSGDDYRFADRVGAKHKTKGWYLHPVDKYCAVTVGKFCGVVPFTSKGDSGELTLRMFGMDSDVELAGWMLTAFKQQFEADWERYKRFQMESKRLIDVREARLSFARGFTSAVCERLEKWMFREVDKSPVGGSDGTSLVIKKRDLAMDELRNRGIILGRASRGHGGRASTDTMAAGAGYNSGAAANVGRATAGTSTIMIGG